MAVHGCVCVGGGLKTLRVTSVREHRWLRGGSKEKKSSQLRNIDYFCSCSSAFFLSTFILLFYLRPQLDDIHRSSHASTTIKINQCYKMHESENTHSGWFSSITTVEESLFIGAASLFVGPIIHHFLLTVAAAKKKHLTFLAAKYPN